MLWGSGSQALVCTARQKIDMVRVMGGTLLWHRDTGFLGRVFWDQAHTTIVRRQIYAGDGRASGSIARTMESLHEPWPKQDLPLDPTS